ncbi:CLUMA_CG010343, isoform A [Clunio marinus]|uniref:CLUMA_CG010343, isoform A n=1 Tax=Clunio marinus TaxID=568069 RepID=A0A1J1I9N0_9DIPT|nr:CLUMA_CG010343, isoform A [Clunio marinus]
MFSLFTSVCVLSLTLSNVIMAATASDDLQFTKASNSFATDLYQKTIEGKNGNVIISPLSIQSALTLAMFGATGSTRQEMLTSLKYPADYTNQAISQNFETFTEKVKSTNGLKIANKVYVMKKYSVKKSFNDVAMKSFASEAQSLDFAENVQSAATINGWVEDHTNNKIKDLVKPDTLDSDTRMVLVNAIYFKGFWEHQFKPSQTFKAPFYLNDQDTANVDFMKIKEHFKYGMFEDLDATAIDLPYKDSDISMLIILPNSRTGLPALEQKLNTIDLASLTQKMYKQEVRVELPKFKVEFEINLNEPLEKMGMERMFSNAAEFNDLLEENDPLKVSAVVHKAFIEVNEEGAEAAAATGVQAVFLSAFIGPSTKFIANHPFLFYLRDNESKILFLGRTETI